MLSVDAVRSKKEAIPFKSRRTLLPHANKTFSQLKFQSFELHFESDDLEADHLGVIMIAPCAMWTTFVGETFMFIVSYTNPCPSQGFVCAWRGLIPSTFLVSGFVSGVLSRHVLSVGHFRVPKCPLFFQSLLGGKQMPPKIERE